MVSELGELLAGEWGTETDEQVMIDLEAWRNSRDIYEGDPSIDLDEDVPF